MGFYRDLVAHDIYKPYLYLEFGGNKVCAGIVGNDIGRFEISIDLAEFQSLPGFFRYKYSKKTICLKRCGCIDYM